MYFFLVILTIGLIYEWIKGGFRVRNNMESRGLALRAV